MENTLIQIYLFVCQIYDTSSETCFQRVSNNSKPNFTDQELITIWLFAHLNEKFQKKQMRNFIKNYWLSWFPALPSYQSFVLRLNQLEPTFQTMGLPETTLFGDMAFADKEITELLKKQATKTIIPTVFKKAFLSTSILLLVCLTAFSQWTHPLEPIGKHYKTLAALSPAPNPNRASLELFVSKRVIYDT